jgi:VWFA-related protein
MSPRSYGLGLLVGALVPLNQDLPKTAPVFGIEVENVYIDAFVTQGNTPLQGLKASNFELKDNGVTQSLELLAADTRPLLAVFAFDASNSLGGQRLSALRAASQAILDTLRTDDEASLFTFADDVRWLARPTADKPAIRRALAGLQPGGGTAVMDALYSAILLPEARGRSLVVLFTDGVDNSSFLDWRQVLKVAERSNALIHVVSLRDSAPAFVPTPSQIPGIEAPPGARRPTIEFEHTFALRQIAEATGGRYWEAESLDKLRPAFAAIAEAMAKRYVLRYVPENVKREGWHKIELRLKGARGRVQTRSGYWVRSPAP